jgi:hypothetical protein
LFPTLLGDAYAQLPAQVRALHDRALPHRFTGRVHVRAARSRRARLVARLLGLPLADGEAPLEVTIQASGSGQRWTRHFPPRPMVSDLDADAGLLRERLGPATLRFRLDPDADGLTWTLVGVRLMGLPLPLALFRACEARESEREGRYRFFVRAQLPGFGLLVGYEGWLDLD